MWRWRKVEHFFCRNAISFGFVSLFFIVFFIPVLLGVLISSCINLLQGRRKRYLKVIEHPVAILSVLSSEAWRTQNEIADLVNAAVGEEFMCHRSSFFSKDGFTYKAFLETGFFSTKRYMFDAFAQDLNWLVEEGYAEDDFVKRKGLRPDKRERLCYRKTNQSAPPSPPKIRKTGEKVGGEVVGGLSC